MRRITLKFNIGKVNAITNRDSFFKNKCHLCGQTIYFVKALNMKKFIGTKISDDEYVLHSLVCEELQKRKRFKELRKMSKNKSHENNKRYNKKDKRKEG